METDIPPIYKLIAKLLRSQRRKATKRKPYQHSQAYLDGHADHKAAAIKMAKAIFAPTPIIKRKYRHSEAWIEKHRNLAGELAGELAAHLNSTVAKLLATPAIEPMPLNELMKLDKKSDEVDARGNEALADAYALYAKINNSLQANTLTTENDVKQYNMLGKRLKQCSDIIKQLGGEVPKATS